MDVKDIRRINLLSMIRKEGTAKGLAARVNTAAAYISQILSSKTKAQVGSSLARRIEEAYNLPFGWMDVSHGQEIIVHPRPQYGRPVPLLNWTAPATLIRGGTINLAEFDTFITAAPASNRAFALPIISDIMLNLLGSPSFPPGEVVICDPEAKAVNGSYVIAHTAGAEECTFKQLINDVGTRLLRPLNPNYPIMEMNSDDVICGVVIEAIARFI